MAYKFNPFTGNLDEVGAGGGGGTPGGSDTQIQFNDAGSFGGDVDLTWNKTTNVMTLKGDLTLDDNVAGSVTTLQTITPTQNNTISLPNATGTVALVAGSSGQLLWNNAGANAGASTLTYDGSILTTSGRFINSYNAAGIASAPAKAWTGTWFTTGTATTTKPHVLIEPTGTTSAGWSTSGTGFGVNAASGFVGNLLDLQVNGTSHFRFGTTGLISGTGLAQIALGNGAGTSNTVVLYGAGTVNGFSLQAFSNISVSINNALPFGWSSSVGGALDVALFRDAANTLAQRNGTSAQTFRVYNTYTSSTNYELGKLEWTSNAFRIGTEKGSGGGTARALELQTDGLTKLTIGTGSTIESSGSVSIWSGGDFRAAASGSFYWNGRTNITSPANGDVLIGNLAQTDFGRMMFGGTTSSFPALKRSSTTLQVRLADDSAYTTIDAQLRAQGTAPATASSTGTAGDIRYDADYIYVCTATNTWKRAALTTW